MEKGQSSHKRSTKLESQIKKIKKVRSEKLSYKEIMKKIAYNSNKIKKLAWKLKLEISKIYKLRVLWQ